ncbi:MAG: enoyl-CoA hydratase/isomerase family protein [Acidimicrobiales bacterium]
MTFELFSVDRHDDGTATLTITRAEKLNAMNQAFFRELIAVVAHVETDDSLRAVVLTGSGRAFSAGGDIGSFSELDTIPAYRDHLRLVYDAFCAVERSRVAVIGAVNGIAYGGGTELTLACDVAIASTDARFAFREVTVGLTPGWGVVRGPDVIGRPWTKWLALTGDVVDAARALEIGLVQRVVEPDRLMEESLSLARRIAHNPPLATAVGKQFVNRGTTDGFAESIEAVALLFATPDHKAAVRAFRDRPRGGVA